MGVDRREILCKNNFHRNCAPFAPITKTNTEEDIGFGGNLDKRVANKLQLMELKDKGNIARNRKKILVNINAFLDLAHYKINRI